MPIMMTHEKHGTTFVIGTDEVARNLANGWKVKRPDVQPEVSHEALPETLKSLPNVVEETFATLHLPKRGRPPKKR